MSEQEIIIELQERIKSGDEKFATIKEELQSLNAKFSDLKHLVNNNLMTLNLAVRGDSTVGIPSLHNRIGCIEDDCMTCKSNVLNQINNLSKMVALQQNTFDKYFNRIMGASFAFYIIWEILKRQ